MFLAGMIVLAVYFACMAIGLLIRGHVMRGGCGTESKIEEGKLAYCEACPKKEISLCESEDTLGLPEYREEVIGG